MKGYEIKEIFDDSVDFGLKRDAGTGSKLNPNLRIFEDREDI